jgi:hypothetical protein
MRFSTAIMVLAMAAACAIGCEAEGKMDAQEIERALARGVDRQQVETFFAENGIQYGFITREESETMVPKYEWQSEDPIGRYRGLVRDAKTKWWKPSREHISIDVEIDARGQVSYANVDSAYTAP